MSQEITPFQMAERYIGKKEIDGHMSNPIILAMLKLDNNWPDDDKVPWCSAFVNWIIWHFKDLPRSKSLMARSWLDIGLSTMFPLIGDIVILKRGGGNQPGKEVLNAPGHVGFFVKYDDDCVYILGGNQNDQVSIAKYDKNRVLDTRRLIRQSFDI